MGNLLWIIIAILIILWLLGFLAFDMGALVHILLVIALILLVYRLATGKRVV
jgi:membrane protein implicated in regulation of membrane protease activity